MDMHPTQFRVHIAQIITDPDFIERAVDQYKRDWAAKLEQQRQAHREISAELRAVRRAEIEGEATINADQSYRDDMEKASVRLLDAIERARSGIQSHTPQKLRWGESQRNNWADPNSENTFYAARRLEVIHAREAEIDARRIADREPCTRCGVRGDIGCKHKARGF